MVDTKTETKTQNQHEQKSDKPVNPRDAIREKRQRRLRLVSEGNGTKAGTVKVFAANEDMRAVLRHPAHNSRFRDTLDQGVEWPNDSFTKRRIADGSVRTDGPGSGDAAEPDQSLNARQQSAARKGEQKVEEHKEEHSKNGSKPRQQPPQHQPQPQPPAA